MRWLIVVVLAVGLGAARAEIIRVPPYDDPTRTCWVDTEADIGWCEDIDTPLPPVARLPMLAAD